MGNDKLPRLTKDGLRQWSPADKHHLQTAEWNAVSRYVGRDISQAFGFQDEQGDNLKEQTRLKEVRVEAFTEVEIPPYSVFGITNETNFVGDAGETVEVQIVPWEAGNAAAKAGSLLGMYTNKDLEIKANEWGWAYPINNFDFVELREAGANLAIGDYCGPAPGDFTVEEDRTGFIVNNTSADGLATLVVQRTDEPHALVGIVTEQITAFNPLTKAIGKGKVKIEARDTGEKSVDMSSWRDSNALEITVWNYKPKAIETDTRIRADNVLGVGIVATEALQEGSSGSPGSGSPGSGSPDNELCTINGIDLASLPVIAANDAQYVLGLGPDGCMALIPIGDCDIGSGSGSS